MTKNRLYLFLITAVILSIAGYFWYEQILANREPPLLKASELPTRVKPQDPGGSIANDNNPIYDQLKNPHQHVKAVTLVPEPEEPMTIGQPNAASSDDIIGAIVSDIVENAKEPAESQELQEAPNVKSLKIVTIADDRHARAVEKKSKSAYYIQIASTRTKAQAEKEWVRISKTHTKLLANISHKCEKYTTDNKALLYMLLAGPLNSAAHAKLLCKKLVNARQNCIIKKL